MGYHSLSTLDDYIRRSADLGGKNWVRGGIDVEKSKLFPELYAAFAFFQGLIRIL